MVPHDPAHRARLSYAWRDARFHLIDEAQPLVVLISDSVSQGNPHPTIEAAEAAFWELIVNTIMGERSYVDPYACWNGVEIAAVADPESGKVHLAERRPTGCRAWELSSAEHALLAFFGRLRLLIPEGELSSASASREQGRFTTGDLR